MIDIHKELYLSLKHTIESNEYKLISISRMEWDRHTWRFLFEDSSDCPFTADCFWLIEYSRGGDFRCSWISGIDRLLPIEISRIPPKKMWFIKHWEEEYQKHKAEQEATA